MDWGFFDTFQGDNKFLREETVYSSNVSVFPCVSYFQKGNSCKIEFFSSYFQTFYYFAIVEDFVLRWIWALGFFLTESGYIRSEAMQCIIAPLEVFR